jgi:type III secretion system low calcium response chaperone LcrH/SycD
MATTQDKQPSIEGKANKESEAIKEMAKGTLPKDIIGLNDEMVEGIYGQAYRLYNNGKYDDAIELFRLLIMMNPVESKYVLGMAACLHMNKHYKGAVDMYALCAVLDPETPIPYYHSYDCYLHMKDKLAACISLEMTIKKAGNQTHYQTLKDRAVLTLEGLKKELKTE